MGFKTEKELEDYLTDSGQWAYKRKNKTNTEPQRLAKESRSDTEVIVNNGKIQTLRRSEVQYDISLIVCSSESCLPQSAWLPIVEAI